MLQSFTLRNFKLFDEQGVTIEHGKITVLIGANGTGKSSVLQAMLLLKQSLGGVELVTEGPIVGLGPYREIVHGQDPDRRIEVGLSASYEGFEVFEWIEPLILERGVFEYRTVLTPQVIEQEGILGGGVPVVAHWTPNPRQPNSPTQPMGKGIDIGPGIASFAMYSSQYIGSPFYITSSLMQESPAAREAERKVRRLFSTVETLLQSYYYLPPIRGFDKRSYGVSPGELPADLTRVGGTDEQAALVVNLLASDRRLTARVVSLIDAVLGGNSGLGTRLSNGHVVGETDADTISVNLFNEAFGLNQLLAPLVWLAKVAPGAVIGIEEPEIHLHPQAQAALCDVLVEVATGEGKQLILTTHSEHILIGLLTAVGRGRLRPDELAVYEFRREGAAARVERLEVNEYGQVAGGLGGFLEVDVDQLGKLIDARFGG